MNIRYDIFEIMKPRSIFSKTDQVYRSFIEKVISDISNSNEKSDIIASEKNLKIL